jgi:opacity protein-like surface antigen
VRFIGGLLLAASLLAADRSGPYLGAGVGIGTYDDDGWLASVTNRNVPEYRIAAGAFINENFSVALEYGQFDTFKGETADGLSAPQDFKMLTANVYGHYPVLDDRLDLYGKFGAGEVFWTQTAPNKINSNAATLVYGLGVGIRATQRLTFNLGYDLYTFSMDSNGSSYNMLIGSAYLDLQVQF